MCSSILSAQDTLYLKGEKKPLIVSISFIKKNSLTYLKKDKGALKTIRMKNVKRISFQKAKSISSVRSSIDTIYLKWQVEPLFVYITSVKEKSLNYTKSKGGALRTVKMENIKEIRYGYRPISSDIRSSSFDKFRLTLTLEEMLENKREEYRSTISIHSAGLIGQGQFGFNYMHRLEAASTERMNYWLQIGGGSHEQNIPQRIAKGHYWELGGIVEIQSMNKIKQNFHIGCDLNFQFSEVEEFSFGVINRAFEFEERRLVLQFPIGYTFRGDNGFYLAAGFELTTITKFFPAFDFKIGYAFGKQP